MAVTRRNVWRISAALFLTALFTLQFYRAATQSITVDEARVYTDFIQPNPTVVLNQYEAGHHILQTYLSQYFSRRWGGSELVLRIPALAACAAFFAFAFQFCSRLLGRGALFFVGVLVLASNPFFLDHLSIARGYGVALAFFAWVVLMVLDYLNTWNRNRLTAAGIVGGLSVAANLTFLLPVLALAGVTIAVHLWKRPSAPVHLINDFLGPGVVICSLLIMLPLSHVDAKQHYYFGAGTLSHMFATLAAASFDRRYWDSGLLQAGSVAALAGLIAGVAAAVKGLTRSDVTPSLVITSTLALALCGAVVGHWLFHVPYPLDRTGLWVVFLITAAAIAGVSGIDSSSLRGAVCIPGVLIAGAFIAQYDPRYAFEWRFTAATKHFMNVIRARELGSGRPFTVSGNAEYKFPADYYRNRLKLAHMAEFAFGGPAAGADYYLFHGGERRELAARYQAQVLEDDPLCLCLVAAR